MNRKKRKLAYIRKKNSIRRFQKVHAYFKVSDEVKCDVDFLENILQGIIISESKKYKTKLEANNIVMGQEGQDYARDIKTVKLTYSRQKQVA